MEARQEALSLGAEYRKSLQDSLVYDFGFEDANEELAQLLIDDIILAIANGENAQRELLENQFNTYLQQLSTKRQKELSSILSRKRTDAIIISRARKGSLIGQQSLKANILEHLQQNQLISLIGTAGVGKTRLALEVIYDFHDDAKKYFCDVTDARSELDVVRFVAKAMDIQLRSIDPIGQVGELFSAQKTILVLDKLEQVIEPVKNIIKQWVNQSETLRIVATSRVKLRLPMEHSLRFSL